MKNKLRKLAKKIYYDIIDVKLKARASLSLSQLGKKSIRISNF